MSRPDSNNAYPFSGQGGDEVEESKPVFHSMALGDDFGVTAPSFRSPSLMGPPKGLGPLRKANLSPVELNAGLGKPVVSSFAAPENGTWNVADGSLKVVPEFWSLERTSRFIVNIGASVVAERIAKCLQSRSVTATFNSKGKAKCFTEDLVEFRIKLFCGRGDYSNGVIVEVQKRVGSSVTFRKECTAVLDAAEGIASAGDSSLTKLRLLCNLDVAFDDSVRVTAEAALEQSMEMLNGEAVDAQLLALESLVQLTDATKAGEEIATFVSTCLVHGSEYADLRTSIASLVQATDCSSEDEIMKDPLKFASALRDQAFVVLANACIMTKGTILGGAIAEQAFYANELVPFLLSKVKCASECPRNAVLSVKCLDAMAGASPAVKEQVLAGGFLDTLASATAYGKRHHESLAVQSEGLATMLSSVY